VIIRPQSIEISVRDAGRGIAESGPDDFCNNASKGIRILLGATPTSYGGLKLSVLCRRHSDAESHLYCLILKQPSGRKAEFSLSLLAEPSLSRSNLITISFLGVFMLSLSSFLGEWESQHGRYVALWLIFPWTFSRQQSSKQAPVKHYDRNYSTTLEIG
jgi:hypothetical protein